MTKDVAEHNQTLKDDLLRLNVPIIQLNDQILAIQDNFDSEFFATTVSRPVMLKSC